MGAVDAHIKYYFRKGEVEKLNKHDKNGYAPIHYAAKFNRYDIMKKLVTTGEDIVEEGDEDDLRSGRPLTLAHSLTCQQADQGWLL